MDTKVLSGGKMKKQRKNNISHEFEKLDESVDDFEPASCSSSLSQTSAYPKRWLILVDIQEDFCAGGHLAATNSVYRKGSKEARNNPWEEVKILLKNYGEHFERTIVTQDYHPKNHISFASTHGREPYSTVYLYYPDNKSWKPDGVVKAMPKLFDTETLASKAKRKNKNRGTIVKQVLWPDHCVQGSGGENFVNGFKEYVEKEELNVYQKGKNLFLDSYSGVWGASHLEVSDLYPVVNEARDDPPEEVIVVGIALDYCCSFTAEDLAIELPNSRIVVIPEATRFVAETFDEAVKDLNFRQKGRKNQVEFVPMNKFLDKLDTEGFVF